MHFALALTHMAHARVLDCLEELNADWGFSAIRDGSCSPPYPGGILIGCCMDCMDCISAASNSNYRKRSKDAKDRKYFRRKKERKHLPVPGNVRMTLINVRFEGRDGVGENAYMPIR